MADNNNGPQFNIDNTVCSVCRRGEPEGTLLLCDGCPAAMHTTCIGLPAVPPGDWYCAACEMDNVVGQMAGANLDGIHIQRQPDELAQGTPTYVYERVSSKGQDNPQYGNHGLSTQNSVVLAFAAEKGLLVKGTWQDIGSAFTGGVNEQFRRMTRQFSTGGMLRDYEQMTLTGVTPRQHRNARPFCVLVYSVSRFSRNMSDTTQWLNFIHYCGGYVYSVSEEVSSNNTQFLQIAREAENQSRMLSRALQDSVQRRRNNGEHIGQAPFGKQAYRNQRGLRLLRDDPTERFLIDNMVNWYNEGNSSRQISEHLNRVNQLRRGRRWSPSSVNAVLRNAGINTALINRRRRYAAYAEACARSAAAGAMDMTD